MYVANGRENYWADQDETSTTYSLQPRDGSAQKKIWKNSKGGPRGPFFVKKMRFSRIFQLFMIRLNWNFNFLDLTPARWFYIQKKFEKIQKGARGGPFLLKKIRFSRIFRLFIIRLNRNFNHLVHRPTSPRLLYLKEK